MGCVDSRLRGYWIWYACVEAVCTGEGNAVLSLCWSCAWGGYANELIWERLCRYTWGCVWYVGVTMGMWLWSWQMRGLIETGCLRDAVLRAIQSAEHFFLWFNTVCLKAPSCEYLSFRVQRYDFTASLYAELTLSSQLTILQISVLQTEVVAVTTLAAQISEMREMIDVKQIDNECVYWVMLPLGTER